MDNRKITLAITSWERVSLTLESFAQVLDSPFIDEIVIVDDCSHPKVYEQLKNSLTNEKIKLYRNEVNLDCYRCKHRAVELSSNEWLILLDSDNIITKEYIDRLYEIPEWDPNTFYQPSFAKPHFDFREFEGYVIKKWNIAQHFDRPMWETLFNAANYFVNRDRYLEVWDGSVDPHSSDSIYQNFNHIKSGGEIRVVPGLFYEHRVHDASHYKLNNHKSPEFYKQIVEAIKQLH